MRIQRFLNKIQAEPEIVRVEETMAINVLESIHVFVCALSRFAKEEMARLLVRRPDDLNRHGRPRAALPARSRRWAAVEALSIRVVATPNLV